MQGLLSAAERKNGGQMAEAVGESTPYALQQFIYRGRYSADGLKDDLREYVNEKLGEEDRALVVDETGFLKEGKCHAESNGNTVERQTVSRTVKLVYF